MSQQAAFDGTKVLDGSKSKIDIQVGSQDGQTISIKLQGVDSGTLGLTGFNVNGNGQSVAANTSGLTDTAQGGTGNGTTQSLVSFKGSDGNTQYAIKTVDYTGGDPTNSTPPNAGTASYTQAHIDADGTVTYTGKSFDTDPTTVTAVADGAKVTSNTQVDTSGLTSNQKLVSYDADGKTQYAVKTTNDGTDTYTKALVGAKGKVTDTGDTLTSATVGTTTDVANGSVVATPAKTANPLAALDKAISTVDALRSGLGAVQNRFDSAINNIDSTTVKLSSARSRITDVDYATEVSNLSKAKILQQAGQSVLAQANQTSQGVITLLRSA